MIVRHLLAAALLAVTAATSAAESQTVAKPLQLRGTLGDAQIQMRLQPKEDIADGWEGSYFRFGHSLTVLLAGELEGGELALEESENGTDVSGQWNGTLRGDTLAGEWMSADGTVTKPFSLNVVPAAPSSKKPAANSSR